MSARTKGAPKLKIKLEAKPHGKAKRAIGDILDSYNRKFEKYDDSDFVISLRDGAGRMRGGFYVVCYYDAAFIKWVAIDEALRGKGLGRKLMAAAEKEARKRGAKMIWLDTFSYQAKPFYEKLGYKTFGTLKYPREGLSRAFMAKKLS